MPDIHTINAAIGNNLNRMGISVNDSDLIEDHFHKGDEDFIFAVP